MVCRLHNKMGSTNGKPVLRDVDVEDLVKSSGLSEDEVIGGLEVAVSKDF